MLVAAVYADQQLDLVVIGRKVLVANGPIEPQPIPATRLEVVATVAQRDSPPVIRATPQHARPPPIEATRGRFGRAHIRLSGYLPAAIHRRVVEPKRLLRRSDTPQRRQVRGLEHGRLSFGGISASGLEHEYLRSLHAQRIG